MDADSLYEIGVDLRDAIEAGVVPGPRMSVGGNALFMHVTLVPYIGAAGELKTKPTQQSIAKLREIGIQPHVVLCRSELPIESDVREKISMFCNVPAEAVMVAIPAATPVTSPAASTVAIAGAED